MPDIRAPEPSCPRIWDINSHLFLYFQRFSTTTFQPSSVAVIIRTRYLNGLTLDRVWPYDKKAVSDPDGSSSAENPQKLLQYPLAHRDMMGWRQFSKFHGKKHVILGAVWVGVVAFLKNQYCVWHVTLHEVNLEVHSDC